MSESQHNAVILRKGNQVRFNQLWGLFAKSEANSMRLSEFMQFVIDRCLLSNRTTIQHFYQLFLLATEKRNQEPQSPQNVVIERTILKHQFIFLLNELGKYVYHNDRNQQDRVYNDMLGEKSMAERDTMQYSRVMIMDEINRKLTLENAIRTLSNYEDELKNIYLIYVDDNYFSLKKQGRVLLTHRQVDLQNKRLSAVSFVRFLKEADVLPHLINIEHVEQILSRVVPGTNSRENEFYYKHFLVEVYGKELDNPDLKNDDDPGMLLFQFMFLLARLAIQTSKEIDIAKKSYDYVINKFLSGYLCLRTNQEIKTKPLTNANKIYLNNLHKYYDLHLEDWEAEQKKQMKNEEYNPLKDLVQKQEKMNQLAPLQFNIPNMLRLLEAELPPLPAPIVVVQEFVPPANMKFKDIPKVTMGQQPPPEKVDKSKAQQKPAPKKQTLKKGEKPPRVFQYMKPEEQTKKVERSQDYFQKLATELDYSLKPLTSLDRGDIPLNPFPSVISEILYPPQVPQAVLPFIEAGLNAHNDGAFALAIDNYNTAQQTWRKIAQLSPNLELYFEFVRGSVYLSAGKDDYAFNSFFNSRNFLDKIPYLSPDRALPYCGMGESLYNAEEYQLAARSYLKARQIREALLGIEAVDTATVFNNLGCCFFMFDRNKEALSYLKVAKEVLIGELGQFHQRAQTARENVHLCNAAFYHNTPQYRKMWEVFERDVFGKKKKKKKKDGKKK